MSKTPLSHYLSYTIDSHVDPAAVTNYGGLFPYLDPMLLTDLPGVLPPPRRVSRRAVGAESDGRRLCG